MEMKHLYTHEQKHKWFGDGPWVEEPDEAIFEHEGYLCHVIRIVKYELDGITSFGGHFCGYVRIPEGHPWYEPSPYDIDCDVHGGLTYGGFDRFELGDGYWVGFDCGHARDIVPSIEVLKSTLYRSDNAPILPDFLRSYYRNIAYAIGECKSLAHQAHEVANVQTQV